MKLFVIVFCVAEIALNGSPVFGQPPRPELVQALIQVESSGDDNAIGDKYDADGNPLPPEKWAYGPLQIHQAVCDDVNRHLGTSYQASDCQGNRALSIEICIAYIDMYATAKKLGHDPTDEDMARMWNGGGPSGWKRPSTIGYWTKVQVALEDQS